MAGTSNASEMRLAPTEVNDLASAVCLILFLIPLIQMLFLSAWLAIFILKFRLIKYGWRKGRLALVIAILHAATSIISAAFSKKRDTETRRIVSADRFRLDKLKTLKEDRSTNNAVILIPGTWDASAELPDYFNELVDGISNSSQSVTIYQFKWPSSNEAFVRSRAAEILSSLITAAHTEEAFTKVSLVGYSHGGTIAELTSTLLGDEIPNTVVTASSPTIVVGTERMSQTRAAAHVSSPNDPLLAQLQVSHSARRRQFAVTRLMQRQLNAGLNLSLIASVIRMFVALTVLSVLPNIILLALYLLRDSDPNAIPKDMSIRQIMWIDFVLFGTLFVLWFKNPIVTNVYRLLRKGLFAILFTLNTPVFAALFGVSASEVISYRFRLRDASRSQSVSVQGLSLVGSHRGVLSSSELLAAVLRSVN